MYYLLNKFHSKIYVNSKILVSCLLSIYEFLLNKLFYIKGNLYQNLCEIKAEFKVLLFLFVQILTLRSLIYKLPLANFQ